MIFKITYQTTKNEVPRRETTRALYIESANVVEARKMIEKNTPYNIEFIQPIEGEFLEYEQSSPDFKITSFPELSE